ncbi:hypothetical protein QBC38DRAFT_462404, partial [Podospora fimiseda]
KGIENLGTLVAKIDEKVIFLPGDLPSLEQIRNFYNEGIKGLESHIHKDIEKTVGGISGTLTNKIDSLRTKVGEIDERITGLPGALPSLKEINDNHSQRLKGLESNLARVSASKEQVRNIAASVKAAGEATFDTQKIIDEFETNTLERVNKTVEKCDGLGNRVDLVRGHVEDMHQAISAVKEKVDGVDKLATILTINDLEGKIDNLATSAALVEVQRTISAIEDKVSGVDKLATALAVDDVKGKVENLATSAALGEVQKNISTVKDGVVAVDKLAITRVRDLGNLQDKVNQLATTLTEKVDGN